MKTLDLQTEDGKRIARQVRMACSFTSRCVGLLGRGSLDEQEGLLLSPGAGIHTLGMRFPIDVVFLSRQMRILGLAVNVAPWCFRAAPPGTGRVLELAAGRIEAIGLKLNTYVLVSFDPDYRTAEPREHRHANMTLRSACERPPIQFSLRLPLQHLSTVRPQIQCSTRTRVRDFSTSEERPS